MGKRQPAYEPVSKSSKEGWCSHFRHFSNVPGSDTVAVKGQKLGALGELGQHGLKEKQQVEWTGTTAFFNTPAQRSTAQCGEQGLLAR